jgi:adenosylmethionine-8-amino-7-oxononanoate aminotransferase
MTGQTRRREPYEPYLLNFPHIEPPYCYRCPFGKTPDRCSIDCAEELERTIRRIGPHYVSAFIVEPVSGGPLGALAAPDGYFARIREICDRHDVLLIVDEVVTGAGRTGRNMGIDHWSVVPDLITLAKGIGGGYVPIGATLVHERIYAAFETSNTSFRHGETFAGHTLTAAIGSAVLDEIERLDLVARAAEMGELLAVELEALRSLPIVGDVRGKGLLRGIELVRDQVTKAPFRRDRHVAEQVADEAMARGLLVIAGTGCVDGIDGDTIALAPPYIVEPAEILAIADILRSAITTVAARELAA